MVYTAHSCDGVGRLGGMSPTACFVSLNVGALVSNTFYLGYADSRGGLVTTQILGQWTWGGQ